MIEKISIIYWCKEGFAKVDYACEGNRGFSKREDS